MQSQLSLMYILWYVSGEGCGGGGSNQHDQLKQCVGGKRHTSNGYKRYKHSASNLQFIHTAYLQS